jgi:hypothetical protein
MKIIWSIVILVFTFLSASAQERLTGIIVNQSVKNAGKIIKSATQDVPALTLPFFDDFSNTKSVSPNRNHWSDNYVFINEDYPVNSPTIGVATFDAINNQGEIYSHANPFGYGADTLTSQDIRLDSLFVGTPRKLLPADSLYFSFFYQPQGLGNAPAPGDSLVLEFLAPDESIITINPADTVITGTDTLYIPADTIVLENWVNIWSSGGYSLQTFQNEGKGDFRQILVPITDSARFYKPNFRFRFRNIASLADATLPDWQSNGDQWNVDYIYLNIERTVFDSTHADIAFAAKAPRMLERYTSMPYNQYRVNFVNEMAKSLDMKITNLDDNAYNASYRYEVTDDNENLINTYQGGNYFIAPYATDGYVTEPAFANPPVEFVFPINNPEPVTFTVTHILNPEANIGRRINDTTRFTQVFSNYLSYDDGTAEAGYGITPAGAQVAYKFQLNRSDSLFGANMYFNQTLSQGNVQNFYLNVWNDYFGKPGDLIYSRFGYQPVMEDSLNKFFFYRLDSAIMIEPGNFPNLIFYIGWEQVNDNMLNIGFDKNSEGQQHLFYRTFGPTWSTSQYKGALMIRPIIGKEQVLSFDEPTKASDFSVYPNPASTPSIKIRTGIKPSDYNRYKVSIVSADGRTLQETILSDELEVSRLPKGMYMILLRDGNHTLSVQKLIIN